MKKYTVFICSVLLATLVLVSCNKTEWDKEAPLSLKAQSDIDQPIQLEDYTITVEDIELTITGIQIHGERLQSEDVDKVYTDDIYINFSEPQNVDFQVDLPYGTYETLEFSIDFDTEISSPHFSGEIVDNLNQSFQSTIDIPLSFSQIQNLQVLNQDGGNTVLIDENTKLIEFIFNGQGSFNGINLSTWNALINANQGQDEIDLSSALGNQFLNDINENFLSQIQLKITN